MPRRGAHLQSQLAAVIIRQTSRTCPHSCADAVRSDWIEVGSSSEYFSPDDRRGRRAFLAVDSGRYVLNNHVCHPRVCICVWADLTLRCGNFRPIEWLASLIGRHKTESVNANTKAGSEACRSTIIVRCVGVCIHSWVALKRGSVST